MKNWGGGKLSGLAAKGISSLKQTEDAEYDLWPSQDGATLATCLRLSAILDTKAIADEHFSYSCNEVPKKVSGVWGREAQARQVYVD